MKLIARFAFSFLVALAIFLISGPVHAKPTPAEKCAGAKLKATGKTAAAKTKCYVKKKLDLADPLCLQKAHDKLAKAFATAERPGACRTTGDAQILENHVDVFVYTLLVRELLPAARAGTTPTPSPALKCAIRKVAAGGTYNTALSNCGSLSTQNQVLLEKCRQKAADTFDAACTRAEAQEKCQTTCDAIKDLVKSSVTSATYALAGGTPTPTKTRPPTVTPTGKPPTKTPTPMPCGNTYPACNGACPTGYACAVDAIDIPAVCRCNAVCGDGACVAGENASLCPTDCSPVCGNGVCEPGEVCQALFGNTCATCCCGDCGCGDGFGNSCGGYLCAGQGSCKIP